MERATDGMGETTQFINDMWGRATEVVRADGETERYVYDHAGNVIAATDAEGNTATYRFGERNQLVERTDAFGQTEYFCYDRAGNLAEHVDRNGNRTTYAYNMYHSPVTRIAEHVPVQQEILQGSAPYTGRANEKEAGSRYFRVEESYHYDGTIASGPHGCTSKGVSDAAHKELFNIIESSKDFEDYKAKLNKWADNHLELVDSDGNVIKKGAEALPSNLRKKPARIAPCGKKYY